jgi:phosphomannomutase
VEHCRRLGLSFREVAVAGDLRESTPRIREAIHASLRASGLAPLDLGMVPTPALAFACGKRGCPGIMITGSHIPGDRNGLKFYLPEYEILKADEESILALYREGEALPAASGAAPVTWDVGPSFLRRYADAFGGTALAGMKVVLYEHSSAARDLLARLLASLGAEVLRVERSDEFQAVDTEAVANLGRLAEKLKAVGGAALVSTDGDGDRPLVLDDRGRQVPGDLLGLLTARQLGAEEIVCTVSCNTSLEFAGAFRKVHRTKIGSPYVLERLLELSARGVRAVAFEANGGFLLGSGFDLEPLLTRDSFLPVVAALVTARQSGGKLSAAVDALPPRFTQSDLIRGIESERAGLFLGRLREALGRGGDFDPAVEFGKLLSRDTTDGLRMVFEGGGIVHFRPSGNAPEFRVYVESQEAKRSVELLRRARDWVSKRVAAL